jgi:hypothetical protein
MNVGHINDGGDAFGIAVSGNYAFLANNDDGVRIYDISNPSAPVSIGHVNDGGRAFGVAVSSNYLYLANHEDGLRIYDVSTPSNPINIGHIYNGGQADGLALAGSLVFVANDSDGLRVYDASTPSNPINIGHTNDILFSDAYQNVAVLGKYAYVASLTGGLRIYEISNPTTPVYVGQINDGGLSSGFAVGVAASAGHAYLAYNYFDYSGGLRAYDVSIPAQPSRLGYTNTGAAYAIALSGVYACISDYSHGLCVEDISDLSSPNVVACADNPGAEAPGIAISGNYIYVAHAADGLRVYMFAPRLSIVFSTSTTAALSWPTPLAPGFVLQQNSGINVADWLTVTNLAVTVSNRNVVIVPVSTANAFYRLKPQ